MLDSPARGRAPAAPPRRGGLRLRRALNVRMLLTVALLVSLLGGFAIWSLYGSTWLRVEQVKVSGTKVLEPGEVLEAAAVPLGSPVISVDTDAVEARLEKSLPRIAEARVERSWPHGIQVKLSERKPAVLMKQGERFVEVDAEGVRFATVSTPPKGIPVLELAAAKSPSLERFGLGRLRTEAVRVAADLPPSVHRETRTIMVSSYDSITLELADGRTVLWGSPERGAAKAKSLTALMKAVKDAQHFDVSAPSAPAAS